MVPPLEIDIPSRRGRGRAANQLDLLERRADQLLFGLRSLGDPAEDGSPPGFNVSRQRTSPSAPPSVSHKARRRAGPTTPTSARRSQASTVGGMKRASTTRVETVRKRKVPKVAYTSRFIAEAQERADRRSAELLHQVRQRRLGATNEWDKHGPPEDPPFSRKRSPVKPPAKPALRRIPVAGTSAPPTSRSAHRPGPLSPSAALSHQAPRRPASSAIPFSRFNSARPTGRSPLSLVSPRLQTVPEGPLSSGNPPRSAAPLSNRKAPGGTATPGAHASTVKRPANAGHSTRRGSSLTPAPPTSTVRSRAAGRTPDAPFPPTDARAHAQAPQQGGVEGTDKPRDVWVRCSCTQTGRDADMSGPCGVPVRLPHRSSSRPRELRTRAVSPIRTDVVQRVLARQHPPPPHDTSTFNRSFNGSQPQASEGAQISIRTGGEGEGGEIRLRIVPHSCRTTQANVGTHRATTTTGTGATKSDRWPDLSHLANALEMLGVPVGRPLTDRHLSGAKRARSPTANEWAAAVDPGLERSASRSRLRQSEDGRGVSRSERVAAHMQASHRSQLWKELQKKLDVLEEQEQRVRQRYNLPPAAHPHPHPSYNQHDETVIDDGADSPRKSLIEIAVPLDEERASPSRPRPGPGGAPMASALIPIEHDPALCAELEDYRHACRRHARASEATRIKSALPEWQIVNMLSDKLLEEMLEGCTEELESFVQTYAETLFMSL